MSASLSESPMPIRSGAMQRPSGCRCGNTLRHRYDEVGLPCSSTMGSPSPISTYAISMPSTRRRRFWYGNAAEITLPSPSFLCSGRTSSARYVMLWPLLLLLLVCRTIPLLLALDALPATWAHRRSLPRKDATELGRELLMVGLPVLLGM